MMELIELRKRFGGVVAVDDCSYSIKEGEITCLIGPNGAGKTTTINLVSGMFAPDSGTILFEGNPIQNRSASAIARAGLGRTFQVPRELDDFTVLESVKMAPLNDALESMLASLFRRAAVNDRERELDTLARTVLADTGLLDKAANPVRALSGGQKKLLELARVVAFGARLILLDEPTAGVNPVLIEEIVRLLFRLKARGLTFLIVEHNMDFVRAVSDKVIVMAEGKTLTHGSFETVRKHPEVIDAYLGAAR